MDPLQKLIEKRVKSFLESRNRPTDSDKKIRQAIRSIDVVYWKKAQALIEKFAPKKGEKLNLNIEQRLLLDAGVVSEMLAQEESHFYEVLYEELNGSLDKNIFYLSEWLQYRWEFNSAIDNVKYEEQVIPSTFREDSRYQTAHSKRMQSVQKIQHLIRGLPGIDPSLAEMVSSGRIMRHLENVLFREMIQKKALSMADVKLRQFFSSLCQRLKERCLTQQHQKAFVSWMDREDHIQRLIKDAVRDNQISTKIKNEKIKKELSSSVNMLKNLRLIRSLIPLGVASSDIDISFSPFFADINRCTKSLIQRLMAGIHEVDPHLPGDPDILIAPFCGNGFFEWDHNTLILPLTTEHSQNMALVNAVAGYRIMTDALNFNSQLYKAWSKHFSSSNFKQKFVESYHNWTLGIGYGRRHAIGPEEFKFFLDYLGPNPKRGIGPKEIIKLNNEDQLRRLKECRNRINSKRGTLKDYYETAVISWRRHNPRVALPMMEKAHGLDPNDARIHFSLAYLREQVKQSDERAKYEEIIQRHPRTIWKVYSEMRLGDHKL